MARPRLRCEAVRKSYGDRVAVDGVSFEIAPGECYGLLGPNGAGKTTLVSVVCGILQADAGHVVVDGPRDGVLKRPPLGYVPQDLALYIDLNARENLRFFGRVQGITGRDLEYQIDKLLEVVGLADRAREPVGRYSAGMQRRLSVAIGLIGPPSLLVLDEPTLGVDPQSRLAILDTVAELASSGTSVLLTSHQMEEVSRLCRRVGILDEGRLVAEGTVADLVGSLGGGDRLLVGTDDAEGLAALAKAVPGVDVLRVDEAAVELQADEAGRRLPELLDAARAGGRAVTSIDVRQPNLEDVFLARTGRGLRD